MHERIFQILFMLVFSLSFIPRLVSAHVGYVLDRSSLTIDPPIDLAFLLQPFHRPLYLVLMFTTILILLLLIWIEKRTHFFARLNQSVEQHAASYQEFVPWMIRLSLGIALLGAGTNNVFLSPFLSAPASIGSVEVILGFLLLTGFLLAPATLCTILLYVLALGTDLYSLGNLDFLALGISLLLMGDPRPGIDHLFGFPFLFSWQKWKRYIPQLLSVGVGGSMIYLAVYEKFLHPHVSALVVERFHLTSVIPVSDAMWVLSAGLIELAVGLLLILRINPRLISAVAFLVLSLSFFYFKEGVYSHITLFGSLSIIFCYGKRKSLS